jgi:hypothetical protein
VWKMQTVQYRPHAKKKRPACTQIVPIRQLLKIQAYVLLPKHCKDGSLQAARHAVLLLQYCCLTAVFSAARPRPQVHIH